jgi:hypothetical protein
MGGGTAWNMQSIYSNIYHCVTLNLVGFTWIYQLLLIHEKCLLMFQNTRKQLCILLCFSYLKIWVAISGLQPPKQRCRINFWNYSTLTDRMIMRVTVSRHSGATNHGMGGGGYYSSHSQSFTCSRRKCRFQSVCNIAFSGDWTQNPLHESSVLQPKTIRYPFGCSCDMLEFFKTSLFCPLT